MISIKVRQFLIDLKELYSYTFHQPKNSFYNILIMPFSMYRLYCVFPFGLPRSMESNEFTYHWADKLLASLYFIANLLFIWVVLYRYHEEFKTNSILVDIGNMIVVTFGVIDLMSTSLGNLHYRRRLWKALQLAYEIDMEMFKLGVNMDYPRQHVYARSYLTISHVMFFIVIPICELPIFPTKKFNIALSFIKIYTTAAVLLNFGIHVLFLALNVTRLSKLNESLIVHFHLEDKFQPISNVNNHDKSVEVKRFALIFNNISCGLGLVNETFGRRIMYTFGMVSVYFLFSLFQLYRMVHIRTEEYFYETLYNILYGILFLDRFLLPLILGSKIKSYVRTLFFFMLIDDNWFGNKI